MSKSRIPCIPRLYTFKVYLTFLEQEREKDPVQSILRLMGKKERKRAFKIWRVPICLLLNLTFYLVELREMAFTAVIEKKAP